MDGLSLSIPGRTICRKRWREMLYWRFCAAYRPHTAGWGNPSKTWQDLGGGRKPPLTWLFLTIILKLRLSRLFRQFFFSILDKKILVWGEIRKPHKSVLLKIGHKNSSNKDKKVWFLLKCVKMNNNLF